MNDKAGAVFFGVNLDVFRGLPAGALAVLADIKRTVKIPFPVGDHLEQLLGSVFHESDLPA